VSSFARGIWNLSKSIAAILSSIGGKSALLTLFSVYALEDSSVSFGELIYRFSALTSPDDPALGTTAGARSSRSCSCFSGIQFSGSSSSSLTCVGSIIARSPLRVRAEVVWRSSDCRSGVL